MVIYMITELVEAKNMSYDEVFELLRSYHGNYSAWYNNLDCVNDGWQRSFYSKYLGMPLAPCVRKVLSHIGEDSILAKISKEINIEFGKLKDCVDAREHAFGVLVNFLGYMNKYDGKLSVRDYVLGLIATVFRDHATAINKMTASIDLDDIEDYTNLLTTDISLLKTTDTHVVRTMFESMMNVDEIFVTAAQSSEYRQFSFLSLYQLWWFEHMVEKLKKKSNRISFDIFDFNKQDSKHEHTFLTKMFYELMPIITTIRGTGDFQKVVTKITNSLKSVQDNTGVNIPITLIPIESSNDNSSKKKSLITGSWHKETTLNLIVDTPKRDNFNLLLQAYFALGRFHNILVSSGVEFPSYYPDLAKNKFNIYKFHTLYDYIAHSNKVLTKIQTGNLDISIDTNMRPTNFENPFVAPQKELAKFNSFFSQLVRYVKNVLGMHVYTEDVALEDGTIVPDGYKYELSAAYNDILAGINPIDTISGDDSSTPMSDLFTRKWLTQLSTQVCEDFNIANLAVFYRRNARQEMLPLFKKLYTKITSVYEDLKKVVGQPNGLTDITGKTPKLLVTDSEFAVVIADHDLFCGLAKLNLTSDLSLEEQHIAIAAELMGSAVGARELVTYLNSVVAKPTEPIDAPNVNGTAIDEKQILREFITHWNHVKLLLISMYQVAVDSKRTIFDYGKYCLVPPTVPEAENIAYKEQAELINKSSNIKSNFDVTLRKRGYTKDAGGFLKQGDETYLVLYFAGSTYFYHNDGYYINDKLEIKILGGKH